jgi:hypothetical protein
MTANEMIAIEDLRHSRFGTERLLLWRREQYGT